MDIGKILNKNIRQIARRHVEKILKIVESKEYSEVFHNFVNELRTNISSNITEKDAIEMLSQHIIMRPIFEALFKNGSSVKNNPVSISLQKIIDSFWGQTPLMEKMRN